MIIPSVFCFGELLIDMISTTTGDLVSSEGFLKKFGGAPANTAIGLAKLGIQVSFIGKVGDDPFGYFLRQTLLENHVNTDRLILSKKHHTSLAFVSLEKNGERHFSFYCGAHETIAENEASLPKDITLFHFGSLTQTNECCNKATVKLLTQAKKSGVTVSYDPNIRESLWTDLKQARTIILHTLQDVDIVKINETEAYLLSGEHNLEKASAKIFNKNLDALFITLSERGCFYKTKTSQGLISTIPVKAIDTTGAGDAFNAAYIHARLSAQKKFSNMEKKEIEIYLKKATIIASLTTQKKGAITAFPTTKEIKATLKEYGLYF